MIDDSNDENEDDEHLDHEVKHTRRGMLAALSEPDTDV